MLAAKSWERRHLACYEREARNQVTDSGDVITNYAVKRALHALAGKMPALPASRSQLLAPSFALASPGNAQAR